MPLRIVGGDTKRGWWQTSASAPLEIGEYRGIVGYEPSELVITARAGTLLAEIEGLLAAHGQILAFEPPRTGPTSTVGGVVASGLAGPARPYFGAVRDHVLGVKLLGPDGEILRFGGQVMKNVAGYDVSRLIAGSWGRLGPMLEVSLRVAPVPEQTLTFEWRCDVHAAHAKLTSLGREALPVSAAAFDGETLRVRVAGRLSALGAARDRLRPERETDDPAVWDAWRDISDALFAGDEPLWRVIVPPASAPFSMAGRCWWDWGGALRWLRTSADADAVNRAATAAGGHARRWPTGASDPTTNLPDAVARLQGRVMNGFDPTHLFNPV
jgi:glycolate oxidase FAD binding subunit